MLYLSRKSKKSNRTIEAQCRRTDEGFVVLKGHNTILILTKAARDYSSCFSSYLCRLTKFNRNGTIYVTKGGVKNYKYKIKQ